MNRAALYLMTLSIVVGDGLPTRATELLPPDRPIAEVIDHYVDAKLKAAGVTPVAQANDATVVRRLTLDLNGRIPSLQEAQEYIGSKNPQKRAQLVDRLLASPLYIRHTATEFNTLLRGPDLTGPDLRG